MTLQNDVISGLATLVGADVVVAPDAQNVARQREITAELTRDGQDATQAWR